MAAIVDCISALATGSAGASSAASQKKPFSLDNLRDPGDAVPNTFIVEFHGVKDPSVPGSGTEQPNTHHHHGLLGFLSELLEPLSLTPLLQFTNSDLFLGLSLKLDNPNDVATLLKYEGTRAVHPVRRVKLSKPEAVAPLNPATMSAQQSAAPEGMGTANGTTAAAATPTIASEPHDMMGINKLHAEGHFGDGIVVGVIDTGVDYTHSALNGNQPAGKACLGPDCPVLGGAAFVNDNGDRVSTADPFSDCAGDGHGTYCTGLIIGNDTATGFLGVAPQAKARVYRVFGCSDSTTTDVLLAAMQKAYEDKVDVISMSVAGLSGWPEDVTARLASRIVDLDIPFVAANGNDGQMGLFYASHPASARGATGVGSVQNKLLSGWSATVSSPGAQNQNQSQSQSQSQNLTYVTANAFVVNGTSTKLKVYPAYSKGMNSCSRLNEKTPDLSSMLVLIERNSQCGPQDQVGHATDRGAQNIFFYMGEGQGMRAADTYYYPSPQVAVIPRSDALQLIAAASAGDVFVDFSKPEHVAVPDEVAGGWAIASGTSTATPIVAGAYALYRSIKGKAETVATIRAAFASTAAPAPSTPSSGLDTVARQGAGLLQAYNAIHSITRVWPDRLNLNDTEFFNGTQSLTITNTGSQVQAFAMHHVPAGTVYSLSSGGNGVWNGGPVALVDGDQASVTFSPATFSLQPQQSQVVQLTFQAPAPTQDVLPVYSGFVQAISDQNFGNVSVPYLGLAAALSSLPVLNVTQSYDSYQLPGLIDPSFGVQITDDRQVFTLEDNFHQPAFLFGQVAGTREWSLDLIMANTTFNATTPLSRRHLRARAPLSHDTHRFRHVAYSKRQVGNPAGAPQIVGTIRSGETLARDANTYSTIMVNQTVFDQHGVPHEVQDGSYRVLLRVLKLRGNRDEEAGYESYLSHAFTSPLTKSAAKHLQNGYIVELHPSRTVELSSERTAQVDDGPHIALQSFLKAAIGDDFVYRYRLMDPRLFFGVSLVLHNPADVSLLAAFPGIKAVHPIAILKTPKGGGAGGDVRTGEADADTSDIDAAQSNAASVLTEVTNGVHNMTGVARVHELGGRGLNQLIGIIDLGFDYSNAALNGGRPNGQTCFGAGCPFAGGGAAINDQGEPGWEPDPFGDCVSVAHGTHVAGIAIANDTHHGFVGVAPQARVNAYRLTACTYPFITEDAVLASMSRAFHDGVHIVSMSLSYDSGWESQPISALASRLVEQGVIVVAAAGNAGDLGAFDSQAPADGFGVIQAASVDNDLFLGHTAVYQSQGQPGGQSQSLVYVTSRTFFPNASQVFPVYATSKQPFSADDACDPLPSSTPPLKNYVTLIARSTACSLDVQLAQADEKGAERVLVYNRDGMPTLYAEAYAQTGGALKAALIRPEAGRDIAERLAAGHNVTMTFPASPPVAVSNPVSGRLPSYFTQYGPSLDLRVPAMLAAPGGSILSTFPVKLGSFGADSGTSMATPYISASVAAYRGLRGTSESPAQVLAALTTTATPVDFAANTSILDTVVRQGGGLINLFAAVQRVTDVWPDRLALNDSEFFNGTQTLTLTNTGKQTQRFEMQHLPAGTINALDGSSWTQGPLIPQATQQASASFAPASFSLSPGASAAVAVTFKAPQSDQQRLPLYSGFVQAKSDAAYGSVTVPYLGLAATLGKLPVLNTAGEPGNRQPALVDPSTDAVICEDTRTFNLSDDTQLPTIKFELFAGSRLVTVDLVDFNTTFAATIPLQCGEAPTRPSSSSGSPHTVVKPVGNVARLTSVPRDTDGMQYATAGPNMTDPVSGASVPIPNGHYRLLLRALRLSQRPDQPASYDSYLTHGFLIQRR
ncbi:hypothetical protein OC844_003642 [Tilletia horrida]|nr:hypothetical protein OC844_003642 [Tilletia horrida]